MEYSSYNYLFRYGKKQIVYNFITGDFIAEGCEAFDNLMAIKDGKTTDEVKRELQESRFVVESNEREQKYALEVRRRNLLQTDVFYLTVNTTYNCNFDCKYCHQEHHENTNIAHSTIKNVIQLVKEKYNEIRFKKIEISLFGGEPLYNIEGANYILNGIKALSEKYGFEISVFVTTNGSLVTERVINLFKDLKTTFQITLDGDRERHNQTRPFKNGKASYDLILSNIEKILERLPLSRVALRSNFDRAIEVEQYYDIIKILNRYDRKRIYASLVKVFQENKDAVPQEKVLAVLSLFNRFGFVVSCSSVFAVSACSMTFKNSLFIDYDGSTKLCSGTGVKAYSATDDPRSQEAYSIFLNKIPNICQKCKFITKCLGLFIRAINDSSDGKFVCETEMPSELSMNLFLKQEIIRMSNEEKRNDSNCEHEM